MLISFRKMSESIIHTGSPSESDGKASSPSPKEGEGPKMQDSPKTSKAPPSSEPRDSSKEPTIGPSIHEQLTWSNTPAVARLVQNMCCPSGNEPWWPTSAMNTYATMNVAIKAVTPFLDGIKNITCLASSPNALDILGSVINTGILPVLDPLSEEIFDKPTSIAFGPLGISPLYEFLNHFHHAVQNLPPGFSAQQNTITALKNLLNQVCAFNLAVYQFRGDVDRELWDPKGFSEFSVALAEKASFLGVADSHDGLRILAFSSDYLESMSLVSWEASLSQDFGDFPNFDEISSDALVSGHHGLHGLRDLFFEVLDNYDHMIEEYSELLNLLEHLAAALAQRLRSYQKKDGKAKKANVQAQQPPNPEPQPFKDSSKPAQRKSTRKHTPSVKARPQQVDIDDYLKKGPAMLKKVSKFVDGRFRMDDEIAKIQRQSMGKKLDHIKKILDDFPHPDQNVVASDASQASGSSLDVHSGSGSASPSTP
ncbi:hypothetical protein FRC02_003036 [Tulasnella sp. 418]|nr:hypothetical protein FRC02_003036 [Tulasnella sp. 418]